MVVMVVDDERFVRQGIIDNIPWQSLGIDTVLEAKNGLECIEKAKEFPPDILIADIRMPKLNGIDLGKQISLQYPDCKMIIISAYSDKEYLKSAISLNVVAYVEKPLILDELEMAISKAVKDISQKTQAREENLSYELFADILNQKAIFPERKRIFKSASFREQYFTVAVVTAEGRLPSYKEMSERLQSCLQKEMIGIYLYQNIIPHTYIVVLQSKSEYTVTEEGILIYEEIIRSLSEKMFFSVGKSVRDPEDISYSLELAKTGLSLLFFEGYGRVVFIRNEIEQKDNCKIEESLIRDLLYYICCGEKENAEEILGKIWKDIIRKERNYTAESVKRTLGALLEQLESLKIKEEGEKSGYYIWEKITKSNTLGNIKEIFQEFFEDIFKEEKIKDITVRKIIHIIMEEYDNPNLSIAYICEKVNVSRAKACQIFKNETQKTINEYLNEYRISQAKLYLKKDMSLEKVAKKVGYSDSNYFSKIFRKITGMTPTSYRGR